jgi:hypothetical protein
VQSQPSKLGMSARASSVPDAARNDSHSRSLAVHPDAGQHQQCQVTRCLIRPSKQRVAGSNPARRTRSKPYSDPARPSWGAKRGAADKHPASWSRPVRGDRWPVWQRKVVAVARRPAAPAGEIHRAPVRAAARSLSPLSGQILRSAAVSSSACGTAQQGQRPPGGSEQERTGALGGPHTILARWSVTAGTVC